MKKRISFILAVVMIMAVMVTAIPVSAADDTYATDLAADGDTIRISTVADFDAWYRRTGVGHNDTNCPGGAHTCRNIFTGKTIKLMADLDLEGKTYNNLYNALGGTFDGNGHTIENFTQTNDGNFGGLFSGLVADSVIKDLTFKNFTITAKANFNIASWPGIYRLDYAFGILVGKSGAYNLTIDNCVLDNGSLTVAGNEGKYAVAGVVGGFYYQNSTGGMINVLRITNTTVKENVSISATGTDGQKANIRIGSLVGYLRHSFPGQATDPSKEAVLDVTGSQICTTVPAGCGAFGAAARDYDGTEGKGDARYDVFKFIDNAKGVSVLTEAVATVTEETNQVANNNSKYVEDKMFGTSFDLVKAVEGQLKLTEAPMIKMIGSQTRVEGGIRFIGVVQDIADLDALGFTMSYEAPSAFGEPYDVDADNTVVTQVYEQIAGLEKPAGFEDAYFFTFAVTGDIEDGTVFTVGAAAETVDADFTSFAYRYTYTAPAAN